MDNKEFCYVVIHDEFPLRSLGGHRFTTIDGIYHDKENAVARVREIAGRVTADHEDREPVKVVHDGPFKVVYDEPFERWPWLFRWEENNRQITYKVIPRRYKD